MTLPTLHIIADDEVQRSAGFVDLARGILDAGGDRVALHLRGHQSTGRELYDNAVALLPAARGARSWLVINDRIDVALAAGIPAVIVGARSLAVTDARRLLGHDRTIGYSAHAPEEAAEAEAAGADFILLGTIFETASHAGRPGASTGLIMRTAQRLTRPIVAIGGMTPERSGEVLHAGAAGLAVLSGVWRTEDPVRSVSKYLVALKEAAGAESPQERQNG